MEPDERRFSWRFQACFVAVPGLIYLLAAAASSPEESLGGRLLLYGLRGLWVGVFALTSCLLFLIPFTRQSILGYAAAQVGAAVLSAMVVVLFVLLGFASDW